MKKSDTVKIGLGAAAVGIVGYGLYSMKKDTEKLFNGPKSFLDGLFGPDGLLGGSGLPGDETQPVNSGSSAKKPTILPDLNGLATKLNPLSSENLDNFYNKSGEAAIGTASWSWDKYTGLLKSDPLYGMKLGVSLLPGGSVAVGISNKMGGLFDSPQSKTDNFQMGTDVSKIKSHRQADSLGLGMAPLAVNIDADFKKSSDIYFPALEAGPTTKYTEKTSSGSSSKSYTDSTGRVYTPTNVIKAKW